MAAAPPPAAPPPPLVPPVALCAVKGVTPSEKKVTWNCAPPPPVPELAPPAPPPPVMVAVTRQPPGGATQRVVPAGLPSTRLDPVTKGSEATPVTDGEALTDRDVLLVPEKDTDADTVALGGTDRLGVTDEPKDWLRDDVGDTLADAVPVGVTGTHDVRMMEPAAPGWPPMPPPTNVTAPSDAMGHDALKKLLPPPPVAGAYVPPPVAPPPPP